jgi:hypothetical protein
MADAVWLEDGVAARMVSCGRLTRDDNKGGKSGTHTRLHQVEKMQEQDKLDHHGLVLFAVRSLWTRNRIESCTTYTRLTTLPSEPPMVLQIGGSIFP